MPETAAPPVAMPRLGQGTWRMGEGGVPRQQEVAALQLGLDLGMSMIDTAEMYGDGAAEEVVADAIEGRRDKVFLVSKVYPHNASRAGVAAACARSLRRLRTDRLDLYLLHWPGSVPIAETVAGFEALRSAGHIRAWGVSNFDVDEMKALPAGCATNQVLYNAATRGIEFDLLPWARQHGMPVMAYSPVGQGGALLRSSVLADVGRRLGATPAQVALAWTLAQPGIVAIPKAGTPEHVRQNAAAAELRLSDAEMALIDATFPPPRRKEALAIL